MPVHDCDPTPDQFEKARALVAETRVNGGLAPLDLAQFYKDNEIARRDPFSPDAPQPPLGTWMSQECLFAELGVAEDWRRYHDDRAWLCELGKSYNDKAERIVGRRLLAESPPQNEYPETKFYTTFSARKTSSKTNRIT